MSQGPLCPNLSQKVQKEVFQMANRNLSCVILLGGLSVNLNHLKMNAASVVVTCEVVGTLNHYKMVEKNFELCGLRGGGDIKTFRLSLAP